MISILKIVFIVYVAISIYGQGIKDGKKECIRPQIPPTSKTFEL
jgi:hypothetical protein